MSQPQLDQDSKEKFGLSGKICDCRQTCQTSAVSIRWYALIWQLLITAIEKQTITSTITLQFVHILITHKVCVDSLAAVVVAVAQNDLIICLG